EFNYEKSFLYDWKNPKVNNKIAVIYASGQIVEGKSKISPFGGKISMGAETIVARLKVAGKDPRVKAIVLRVDSPGGSAFASDMIWHEIENIVHPKKKSKAKPVVVSMGNLAASGGYYISCNADYIYAEENTLTGSIGIFGATISIEKMLKKIHIDTDSLTTDPNAIYQFAFNNPSDEAKEFFHKTITTGYKSFITKVAKGRKMKLSEVDSIGQGRIWIAKDAKEIGLVDGIGGLDKAIKKAGKLAKIGNVKNVSIQPYPSAGFGIEMPFMNFVSHKVFSKYPLISEVGEKYYSYRLYSDGGNLILLPFEQYEFSE
ncbi:MAG: signal peptide peptidase SppA, partial [Candidatus Marinimicrobia bacterium]|nr:signal peptide peptidase SppA [Candidatus Neomarinimicrobiota bacterium]